MTRQCNGCTACCLTHAVHSINKSFGELCQYCDRDKGCKVYNMRPEECRVFKCQWLHGIGLDNEKPNLTGIVIDFTNITVLSPLLSLYEAKIGALETPFARQKTRSGLSLNFYVIHMYRSGRKVMFMPLNFVPSGTIIEAVKREGIEIRFSI